MGEVVKTEAKEESVRVVRRLYAALGCSDVDTVARILAGDLEWWFHGPPGHDHMRRLLTGDSAHLHFSFNPNSITAVGNRVLVEGRENESLYWVHVWTVEEGLITQVREFFNTSVVVREFAPRSSSSPPRQLAACLPLWQSEEGKSMPGLVLAI